MARVYLSIGSNIERDKNIRAGLDALSGHFADLVCSPVYESVAEGFAGDSFYNLVVGFDTELGVIAVADILREIEDLQQRVRNAPKFSSRTLDLDLLLYDDCVLSDERLQIPRAEIEQYAFVLQPLADIAPTERHPLLNISYEKMWSVFDSAKVAQHIVPFVWQPKPRPR